MRSHFFLLANIARGVSKQRPPRAISGAVAFSPLISRGFARSRASRAPGWRSRRERRAREDERVESAWDGVRALISVPWGERSRDAVNSRPSVSGTVTGRSTVPRRVGLLTIGALSRASAERAPTLARGAVVRSVRRKNSHHLGMVASSRSIAIRCSVTRMPLPTKSWRRALVSKEEEFA